MPAERNRPGIEAPEVAGPTMSRGRRIPTALVNRETTRKSAVTLFSVRRWLEERRILRDTGSKTGRYRGGRLRNMRPFAGLRPTAPRGLGTENGVIVE